MDNKQNGIDRILSEKLISIIRLQEQTAVQATIDALVDGGIEILEITTNTPGFVEEIKKARERHPEVLIGAGTVINVDLAEKAIAAGAQFLVTPNTNAAVAELCIKLDLPVLMGAMTPTEISNALVYGADIIKLFPAGNLGISYFKSLKGPFDSVSFLAVGGVDGSNMNEWFEAGVDGVGLGSSLVASSAETEVDFKEITALAKKFKGIVAE